MKLIPKTDAMAAMTFERSIYPARTYAMKEGRIAGYVDGLDAVRQAVEKLLRTERYCYPVYSANYGVELEDKLGMAAGFALPEIRRCIVEALIWDSRIVAVDGFEFEVNGGTVHVSFTVHSIYGDFAEETEVKI